MSGFNRFLVDTNVFIETLIERDKQYHQDCLEFLTAIKRNKLTAAMAGITLAELVWVLTRTYKFTRTEVVKAVRSVMQLRGLKVTDGYQYEEALRLYDQYKVKYIDCLLASIEQVKQRKWVVVSYDKDFDRLGVKRVEPGEVIVGL